MTQSEAMAKVLAAYPHLEGAVAGDDLWYMRGRVYGSGPIYSNYRVSVRPGVSGEDWSVFSGDTLEQALARCMECLALDLNDTVELPVIDLVNPDPDPADSEPVKVLIAT